MSTVYYPICRTLDDYGAIVTGATVTVASILLPDGTSISTGLATVRVAGSFAGVEYDAVAHGDAWITLAVSKAGSTITSVNASPAQFVTANPSRLAAYLDAAVSSRSALDAAAVRTAVGLASANLDTQLAARASQTSLDALVATVGVAGAGLTGISKAGYKLAADGVDLVVVETGVNLRQAMSPVLAASAGVLSGADTGTIVIKGGNVATTRITATTDRYGNRSAVTLAIPT